MYLEHFKLHEFPFTLTPNTGFYCDLSVHQQVMNVLLVSLRSGEGFIKVTGEVGSGKTLMCRKLLAALGDDFVTAYIPNPNLTVIGLHRALAHELSVNLPEETDQHQLLELISNRLLEYHCQNIKVALFIDEAQVLSDHCLEAIRLLTNLETESKKLLQVVLFGQPELDQRLNSPQLRQLKQRISFSCKLSPIPKTDIENYLAYRLAAAGYSYGSLFTKSACDLLYNKSRGIPRLINVLCHKAMLVAYGRGQQKVDRLCMLRAIDDTESINVSSWKLLNKYRPYLLMVCLILVLSIGINKMHWQPYQVAKNNIMRVFS